MLLDKMGKLEKDFKKTQKEHVSSQLLVDLIYCWDQYYGPFN